jgi:hypothetical protein
VTTVLEAPAGITDPGVYDLTHHAYHADPALSSTGARRLLEEFDGCPALFRYEQDNPRAPSDAFDVGQAAHEELLGIGPGVVVVEAEDWRTKKAQEARADAHLDGKPAVLRKTYDGVVAMRKALERDPIVRALLDRHIGTPEQSIFTRDPVTGVMLRARLDWGPLADDTRKRPLLVDYKTADSASPDAFRRAVERYGYHVQGDWYLRRAQHAGLIGDDAKFLFIVQEKKPPYIVQVCELDSMAMRIGAILGRRAIDSYARCLERNEWPGYTDDVALVVLSKWYENQFTEDL